LLVDKAQLLNLSAPEMAVLVGGLRALGVSSTDSKGVFTATPGKLNNAFFVNILDMAFEYKPTGRNSYERKNRSTGEVVGAASRVDLVFGSNSQLIESDMIAEVYGSSGANDKFVRDFMLA